MQVARYAGIADRYVIWDSDTIPTRNMSFYNGDVSLICKGEEGNHEPYKRTIEDLLAIKAHRDFSFIAQHMPIETRIMRELLDGQNLISYQVSNRAWKVLGYVLAQGQDGKRAYSDLLCFSEYETYGNYIAIKHPELVEIRELDYLRLSDLKRFPHSKDLLTYAMKYHFVAFEFPYSKNLYSLYKGFLKHVINRWRR